MNKLLIFIPTYNERENVEEMVKKIFNSSFDFDLLVADDNSPDGTGDILENLKKVYPKLIVIHREKKMGIGNAHKYGINYAYENVYDYLLTMDCDFTHNPEDIPRFLEILPEYDLIIGSRYITGVNVVNWPLRRLILSYGANFYTRIITGMPIKDATGGFKCFRADILKKIDLDKIKSNGYGFQIEMNYKIWKKKARIKEIPIIFIDRRSGISKMNKHIIWEAIFLVWKLKFCCFKNK